MKVYNHQFQNRGVLVRIRRKLERSVRQGECVLLDGEGVEGLTPQDLYSLVAGYSVVIEQPAHTRTSVKILAVGRLIKTPEPFVAMFDILIGDEANIPKLAQVLLNRLIHLGRAFHFQILAGKFLGLDEYAINLCLRSDFTVQTLTEEGTVQVLLKL